jgi:hypothetical protein
MNREHHDNENTLLVEEILSFHQEKRTALKTLRIGIGLVAAQASLAGLLFATSAYSVYIRARHWEAPLVILNLLIFCLAAACILIPVIRIYRLDHNILEFKQK